MDTSDLLAIEEELLVVNNWPMSLDATREQLQKAQKRLERYRAALRLADVEIKRRNRDIIALTTFAYQASRVADPTTLLKLALVQALETINAPVGAIVLIDEETKALTLGIHKGLTPKLNDILTGQQLGAGATALMPHLVAGVGALLEYHTTNDKIERQLLTASHLTSLVSLPLQLGPRLLGAFLVGLQGKRTFKPAELCFLMALSQETAIDLESLRLRQGLWLTAETLLGGQTNEVTLQELDEADLDLDVAAPFNLPAVGPTIPEPAGDDLEQLLAAMMEAEDEVQQQNADLQTLNTLTEMMNRTLDLKKILQCAVEQTPATMNTDAAWVYLMDDRNQLGLRAFTGLSEAYVRGMQRLASGDGLEGRVAAKNKACFVEAISADPYAHKIWVDKEGLQAMAAVPITRPEPESQEQTGRGEQTGSHVIGVLATGTRAAEGHPWSPREVRLLTSIANQVALAIDNARLYAQVWEDQASLKVGNEVLCTINDMLLEKNAFLEGFIHDDLTLALSQASQLLSHLLVENSTPLTQTQRQDVVTLQEIVDRLSKLTQETGDVSTVLDNEFDKVLDKKDKKDYKRSTRPLRLEKKGDDSTRPLKLEEKGDNDSGSTHAQEDGHQASKTMSSEKKDDTESKAMSFEEAVAAGLVPAFILSRERDQ